MQLRSLYLYQFRNYEEAYLEFNPHFNLIYGMNAQGKTTLLEAIHCLMMGRSFRAGQTNELIRYGASSFFLESCFIKHGIEQKIKLAFDGKDRHILYNSTTLPSVSSLLGILQGVILTPDDVSLVKGAPLLKRQFLDMQIAQIDPLYVHHLTRYNRAMKQRNQLLKAPQQISIESWEHEMGQSAAYIIQQRHLTALDLQEYCQELHPLLTGDSLQFNLFYRTSYQGDFNKESIYQYLVNQFNSQRSRETFLGHTITGPHKDDLLFTIENKDIRHFASEGQQRSCVTVLHLAEWHRLQKLGSEYPLIMIDDVGMGLDANRRNWLLDELTKASQVFLTSTDEHLLNRLKKPYQKFFISKAQIQPV